jgi:hypothetical protein
MECHRRIFVNTRDNSRLDDLLFIPVCTISTYDMETVILKFPSFGELQELGGQGPSLDRLYLQVNSYIEENILWSQLQRPAT